MTPRRPLLVQPREVGFERAAPNAEDVRPLTAKHLSGEPATVAGAAHDLLDRRSLFGRREDGGVGFLAAQIPIILELLGRGEHGGLDRARADRGSNLSPRLSPGVAEGVAWALHSLLAVGDADRPWARLLRRQP